MGKFFIDRPVFAWVIAVFICLAGILSIKSLPVSQYPSIAPPTVVLTTTYPGATTQVIDDSVTSIIEQEMNGADGLQYMESQSEANGRVQITLTFTTATNPDLASVDVQNRLKRVESRLPAAVKQQGVQVTKSRSNFLLFMTLTSQDGRLGPIELGDYLSRNVLNEIRRIPGVGQAQLFATENAMRIWLDPAKLQSFKITPADVNAAITAQNAQVASGSLGDVPNLPTQEISATIVVAGQLRNVEEFGNIVLRANPDGSSLRLKQVARIEVGGQSYLFSSRLDGKPSAAIGVQLSPSANALATATGVYEKLDELSKYLPANTKFDVPYDSSTFVKISITEVIHTLIEAIVLVFLVMFLFLQNIRYTLIPTIVVPVALLGTFAVMNLLGFSINVLTMFGMVLAIGILVDDAIVVVENVERIMSEEGLSPKEATRKAMGQISGAIIGITLVLIAVFIPMAFFSGAVGAIYRQFSMSMSVSIFFSALMALTLTPALCATILKPVKAGHHDDKKGFFGWFNRKFNSTAAGYQGMVARILKKSGRYMVIYAAIVAAVVVMYARLPTSFLPSEDQGFFITNVQLPSGATTNRTQEVIKQIEDYYLAQPAIKHVIAISGFSFSGTGQNAALVFTPLKDWKERGPGESVDALVGKAFGYFSTIKDAIIYPLNPPPIPELGNATGFTFRLQDRAGLGHDALLAARNQLLGMAAQSKILAGVRPEGLEDAAQFSFEIDRNKASALGLTFADINSVISTALGSTYVNDFPNRGRQQQVIVQAEAAARMQPEDLNKLYARNSKGEMVPFSAFTTSKWIKGPVQLIRYNGYPSMKIAGTAAPGLSSGEAMAEMERLASQLPPGFGYQWTGQSFEEKASGAQAPILYALSILAVFLVLAALYESTSIPIAVMLVVPLGIIGALLGVMMRSMPNDVYFAVGMIAVVGLSAKNAILIIEFAKDLQAQGMSVVEATLEAAHLRFRPILMTSFAFILGVLPLVIARGAGSASQNAIGTGVMGGMITATVLAVFFVPVFFVVVRKLFTRKGTPDNTTHVQSQDKDTETKHG
jgi:multidrug efflux pump